MVYKDFGILIYPEEKKEMTQKEQHKKIEEFHKEMNKDF